MDHTEVLPTDNGSILSVEYLHFEPVPSLQTVTIHNLNLDLLHRLTMLEQQDAILGDVVGIWQ